MTSKARCPETVSRLTALMLTPTDTASILAFCDANATRGRRAMWGTDGLPAIFTLARIDAVISYVDVKLKVMRAMLATSATEAKYASHPAVLALLVLFARGHETMEQQEEEWRGFKQSLAERWDDRALAEYQWLQLGTHEKRAAHAELNAETAQRRMYSERLRESINPQLVEIYGTSLGLAGAKAAAARIGSSALGAMILRSQREQARTAAYIEATGLDERVMQCLRAEVAQTIFTGRQSTITMEIMVRGIAKAFWPAAKRSPKKRVLDAMVANGLDRKVLPEDPAQWCPIVAEVQRVETAPAPKRVKGTKRRRTEESANIDDLMGYGELDRELDGSLE